MSAKNSEFTRYDELMQDIANWFKKLPQKRIRFIRLISQIIFFVLFNGIIIGLARMPVPVPVHVPAGAPFATVWGGFSAIQYLLSVGSFPFFVLGMYFITSAIFGKLFCSWGCPVGFWQDFLALFPTTKYKVADQDNRDGIWFAWILIAVTVFVSILNGVKRLNGVKAPVDPNIMFFDHWDPASTLFATLYYLLDWEVFSFGENFFDELGKVDNIILIKLGILILVTIGSMKVPRFYCRYICPTGALLGLVSANSLLTVKKDETKCEDGCKACAQACPMDVTIEQFTEGGITNQLCINCGDCIDACPDALSFGLRN